MFTSGVINGDRLPLPKCSYINTDFPGDDLIFDDDDEPGINAGSARACKARCRLEENCSFWTYKEGFSRDTRPGGIFCQFCAENRILKNFLLKTSKFRSIIISVLSK